MKIAVISSDALPSTSPRKYAGLEVVSYTLAEGLATMGHDVTLFAKNGSERPPGCDLIEFGSIGEMKNHKELLLQHDIITDHSWQKILWSLRIELPELKGICTHHGPHTGFTLPPVEYPNLVGLTRFHARLMQGEIGMPVKHAYNGIDLRYYPLYEGERNNRLLYLNRLHPEKSAHTHIDLAKRVDMPLDLIGTEDPMFCPPDYVELIFKQCDGEKLRLWGDPGQEMKVEIIQRAKALLWITPDFNEPFGMGLIESMSCGTPVIALNRGGVSELIHYGGIVINHLDSFPKAVRNVHRITPEICRANAERFSVEKMCQGYSKMLERVADGERW